MLIKSIPYTEHCETYFSSIADLPYPVWLDSCKPYLFAERFDIIAAAPVKVFLEDDCQSYVNGLAQISAELCKISSTLDKSTFAVSNLPFYGGVIGFLSYDFSRHLEKITSHAKKDFYFPTLLFGLYAWALIADHQAKQSYFVCYLPSSQAEEKFNEVLARLTQQPNRPNDFKLMSNFQSNMTFPVYKEKFDTIMAHIHAGDSYQVNFAQRFEATFSGHPYNAYLNLRKNNPAPLSAYVETPYGKILSASPERFLTLQDGEATSKPIKGTKPRGKTPAEDKHFALKLLSSEKDKAENIMIVDLMRNDFSKVCLPHSITVPTLCALESFSNVHHLVSTIKGKLKPAIHATQLLAATFPGGSVTGTPKISAMNIIDAVEPHRRALYCGSILYIDIFGNMDSNITIRTLLAKENKLYVYGGGAIVADSTVENEYQESITKINNILHLLQRYGE